MAKNEKGGGEGSKVKDGRDDLLSSLRDLGEWWWVDTQR